MQVRRIPRAFGALSLAVLTALATSVVLDQLVDRLDLGYRTRRNAPNADLAIRRSEFFFRIVTNTLGFREPRLPAAKPAGTLRIVVLGDSFTEGYGVAEAEAYPRQLEHMLGIEDRSQRYEVVNLGVPGTNPRDYAGNLRDAGLGYAPDVVLVAVGANDIHDIRIQPRTGTQFGWERLIEARRTVERPRSRWMRLPYVLWPSLYPFARERLGFLLGEMSPPAHAGAGPEAFASKQSGRSVVAWQDVLLALADAYGRRPEVAAGLPALDPSRRERIRPLLTGELALDSEEGEEAYWNLIALIEPDLMSDAVLLPPSYDDAWRRAARQLRAIGRLARRAGAKTVLTFIPDENQVTSRGRTILEEHGFHWNPRTLVDTTFVDRLRALATEEQFEFIDLLGPFRARAAEPLYFPRDGHWTPAGHTLAARLLADGLRNQISPSPPV